MKDLLETNISKLEKELSLPKGFFDTLLNENDWSFIIKLHALFESSISYLLTDYIGKTNLIDIFSNLELSNKKTGKIAFAKALNLLEKDERRYISFLSKLRNTLIHNIQNVNFDLQSYIAQLSTAKKNNFIKAVETSYPEEEKYKKYITTNPKKAIWHTGMYILAIIYLEKTIAGLNREGHRGHRVSP